MGRFRCRPFEAHPVFEPVSGDVSARLASGVPRVRRHVGPDEHEQRVATVDQPPRLQQVQHAFLDAEPADEQDDRTVGGPAKTGAQELGLARRCGTKAEEIHAVRQVMHALARHTRVERLPFDVVPDADDVIGSPVDRAGQRLERSHDAMFRRHARRRSMARADQSAAGFGLKDHRAMQEPARGDGRDAYASKIDADDDIETCLELKSFREEARQRNPFAAAAAIATRSDTMHTDIVDQRFGRLLAAHAFRHDLDVEATAIQVRREPARVRLHSAQHGMIVGCQNENTWRHRASTVRFSRLQ